MADSFFVSDDSEWFTPTDPCRGPWNVDHCHAGPPTGLMARALERALATDGRPDHALTRLTVDLGRPIPMAGFRVEAAVVRVGGSASRTMATIIDGDGQPCATAAGLHLVTRPDQPFPTAPFEVANLAKAEPGPFPIQHSAHDLAGFATSAGEIRYPPGETREPGPTTAWVRMLPLLAGEEPSPVQRICPLADCGNAFGRNAEPDRVTFVNPDLTLVIHRPPVGEWLGSSAISHWQPNGIGMADAVLFDEHGPVGRAVQTLLLRPASA